MGLVIYLVGFTSLQCPQRGSYLPVSQLLCNPGLAAPDSSSGWGQIEKGLWQHPVQLGSQALTSRPPHSPSSQLKAFLGIKLRCLARGVVQVRSSCFSYPLSRIPTQAVFLFVCFAPMRCWRFSSGNLDFHKGSLICGQVPQTVLSSGSRTTTRRAQRVHSQDQVCVPITL